MHTATYSHLSQPSLSFEALEKLIDSIPKLPFDEMRARPATLYRIERELIVKTQPPPSQYSMLSQPLGGIRLIEDDKVPPRYGIFCLNKKVVGFFDLRSGNFIYPNGEWWESMKKNLTEFYINGGDSASSDVNNAFRLELMTKP